MRKWIERVKPWPSLKTGTLYQAEVVDIKKTQKQIEVTVKVLDKEMCGRIISFPLSWPIRPDGLAADFFSVCHITIQAGTQICPRETIGKKLYLQFVESSDSITALSFKPEKSKSLIRRKEN